MTSDATPVFFRLKSRGLIHSGFNLSMRISIKLSKQSVFWRGLGEEKGGRREKYILHNKVLFLNSSKTSRKLFYQLNALSEKLGFFLYLFIGYYKRIDIVLHEKLQVNFQELKRIYLINKKKCFVHVIRVRYSTKEDKPADWQIVNRIKCCVKRRSKTGFFSSWPRSVIIGMQRMQAFSGLG